MFREACPNIITFRHIPITIKSPIAVGKRLVKTPTASANLCQCQTTTAFTAFFAFQMSNTQKNGQPMICIHWLQGRIQRMSKHHTGK